MTKTYNDIDAVTRLLEEVSHVPISSTLLLLLLLSLLLLFTLYQKERDLELAARIGQSLLKKNRVLSEQNEYLEEQVGNIREEVGSCLARIGMATVLRPPTLFRPGVL